jgi:hypothetical protein
MSRQINTWKTRLCHQKRDKLLRTSEQQRSGGWNTSIQASLKESLREKFSRLNPPVLLVGI